MIVIKRIDEPDFGCEGVPDGKPVCDEVYFDLDGTTVKLTIPEKTVWQTHIDEGMTVTEKLYNELKAAAV